VREEIHAATGCITAGGKQQQPSLDAATRKDSHRLALSIQHKEKIHNSRRKKVEKVCC
jgi:hypothetical protein